MSIKLDDIFYIYNENTPLESAALNGVTLDIQEGVVTAIVGKTGSGKSTLAQIINGLLLPTKGTATVEDYVISSNKKVRSKNYKDVRSSVGLVFQFPEYQLFEDTVEKDIAFGPKNFNVPEEEIKKRVNESIKIVGLDESFLSRSPFDLSGGEKRRVALAGILACKPKVLIVDEPTAGLDPKGCKETIRLLTSLVDKNITVIMITHDMECVVRFSNKTLVLDKGKIAFYGDTVDLFKQDVSKFSLDTPFSIKFAQDLNKKGFKLDITKIKNVSTLVQEIKRHKK